jgi:hypothetical protein
MGPQHVVDPKSWLLVLQMQQAPSQQPCTRQHHHRRAGRGGPEAHLANLAWGSSSSELRVLKCLARNRAPEV